MDRLIHRVLDEVPYRENPYFVALKRREFDRQDFIETQIQFHHAVTFFSRPMAALAAKIPSPELRVEVLRNIWEEHGEGDLSRTHGVTFSEFLKRLGDIGADDIQRRALWPEIRIFNTTLAGACVLDDYLIGAAILGIIERMFCEISSWIGMAVVENGWIPREKMTHYNLHEALDVKHAQDFFDVLKPAWDNPWNRYSIEQGLRTGATLFNGLYEGLYRNRRRRELRETPEQACHA